MRNKQLIRNARIPILKLTTEDHIDVDISIGNHGGPQAAMFIKSQVDAYPVVRPVVITAKYLLQAYELNDVSTSGLGSYSLANMVIAYVRNLEQKGESLTDYGKVFLGFLDYFANQFDIRNEAISLRKGAFCHKSEVLKLGEHPGRYRFCIEDYFSGITKKFASGNVFRARRKWRDVQGRRNCSFVRTRFSIVGKAQKQPSCDATGFDVSSAVEIHRRPFSFCNNTTI